MRSTEASRLLSCEVRRNLVRSVAPHLGHLSGVCPANIASLFGAIVVFHPHFSQRNLKGVGRIGMARSPESGFCSTSACVLKHYAQLVRRTLTQADTWSQSMPYLGAIWLTCSRILSLKLAGACTSTPPPKPSNHH